MSTCFLAHLISLPRALGAENLPKLDIQRAIQAEHALRASGSMVRKILLVGLATLAPRVPRTLFGIIVAAYIAVAKIVLIRLVEFGIPLGIENAEHLAPRVLHRGA